MALITMGLRSGFVIVLTWWEWTILALLALTPVTVIEVWKLIRQFLSMASGTPR